MENKYLNFTHGTTLQCFCRTILDDSAKDTRKHLQWIAVEKEKLLRNQPAGWAIPVSTQCYYDYLEAIEKLLQNGETANALTALLSEIEGYTRKKVYALFLTQELACWPSLESVFRAAEASEDYEAALVYTPFFHQNFSEQVDYYPAYQKMGIPVQRHNEYDLPSHSPDVVFIIKPYASIPELYQTHNLERVIPRMIYIPYGMEITTDLIKFGFQYYAHYRAWRHCAYGSIVKEYGQKYGYRNGENIAVWGHPKADHYNDPEKNRENIPQEWKERIGSRKTILWTPHHLIDLNDTGTGTWLIWGEQILDIALKNPEVFFIIRPHPMMMGALVNSGGLSQAQADRLRQQIEEAENIIWDTNAGYHAAFDAADAIITDGTTFSVEFLYTRKPILLTPRNMEGFYLYKEMLESYYVVSKVQDITDYIHMIRDGKDPLKEKRLALYDKTFFVPETGTVGENIMKQVKIHLEKECNDMEQNTAHITPSIQPAKKAQPAAPAVDTAQFPLFSILVLCYKNMDLLFGMLDSIFRQDYPRIQLIVSDDGSEDFDVELVENYIQMHKRPNVEQVLVRSNEVNMRTVRHIHKAMTYVTGDYLVFTAADDRFSGADVVSKYVEQFLRNPDKVWLVAQCNMTSADYSKTLYVTPTPVDEPYFREGNAQRLFSRWSRRGMAIPCCMAFRKDAHELVGGIDLDYLFLEDWPLVLKLLRTGHAPIFMDQIVALHSTGGVSNSNQRYGKEIRKLFYQDKYTIFRKEVDPYLSLLTPEDRKAYKQYMVEIMERLYFFNIDWPDTTLSEKLKLFIRKPRRFWWVFELKFSKVQDHIPKKKFFVYSQALLLLSMLFLNLDMNRILDCLFTVIGYLDLFLALFMLCVSLVTYPLSRYVRKKEKLRTDLVN